MKVKELQKTVNIAWSPLPQNPIYLAAGTAAQQFDSNANSTLEIYSTNFGDPSYDLELKASTPSQYRFQKIIWSPTGFGATHSNGLIVGGCEGGHVMIYSPSKMLANEDGLIARQDKHTGPVSGLDFNPFQTNLLASCASESEIFIWDLNNTSTHMNPGTKTQPFEDVKNVAWNRQVQHILASVFSSRCVIWDLRKSEQIIKLSDTQSRVRWHAIQWHPEAATQVWLASEDDQAPVVQLWDLRYATAPAKTMQIHQRGVLGMSWCPRDIDLMVSCGKDNRIYCWNPNTQSPEGEILSEVATTATWYSDVQWCPRNPALISSSSLDGNVSIYSLFGGVQQQVQTSNKIADSFPGMDQFAQAPIPQQAAPIVYQDLKYAPKWIKKPCGVTFGFGGKLVSFNNTTKTINISQVTTEPVLVERAQALEKSLEEANFVDYCRKKADEMTDQNGRYLWYFIKANFERNPKEEILNLLGFNKEDIDGKFSKYLPEEEDVNQQNQDMDQLNNRMAQLTHQQLDNNAIFDGIAASQKDAAVNEETTRKPQFKIPSGEHADSLITEALLTGNLEAAVQLCLNSKRIPEAFIIASTAGIEFLTKTQNRYLQEQQSELSNVISALVTRDWKDFVTRCTIDSWKEALVAALRHSERKLVDICEKLGDRLLNESTSSPDYIRNSMLCYICAGNIDKLVTAWYKLKQLENQNANYKLSTTELQELAEVVMLMNKSLEEQGIAVVLNAKVADFIKEYGGLLVAQGAFTAALTYIMEIKASSAHPDLDDLKQRIVNIVQPQPKQMQQHQYGNQTMGQPNIHQQQQRLQPRGSFSHGSNQNMNYMGLNTNQYGPTTTTTNTWNSNPVGAQMPPGIFNPAAAPPTAAPPVPTLFNPGSVVPAPVKPPTNDNLPQPPRPLSTSSSQGGSVGGGGGLISRAKYVLDPSVAPAGPMGGYGNTYQPPAPVAPMQAPASFNTTPFNAAPAPQIMQPTFNSSPFTNNTYMPGAGPIETANAAVPPPPMQNIQRNPTPPPGWNDPPALKSSRPNPYFSQNRANEMSAVHAGTRKWQKVINHEKDIHDVNTNFNKENDTIYYPSNSTQCFNESLNMYQPKKPEAPPTATAPITHPLFGVDPNQNQNGYMDPNAHYQQGGMPPPPNQHMNILNPAAQPPQMGQMGSYYNPATAMQNNNMPPQQTMNFQTSAIPNQQQQQVPQWQTQPTQAMVGGGYNDPNQQQQQQQPTQRQPEPPKQKPPLPEEYIYLQTVLEELKTNCLNATNDPRTKRKFVDVTKRLENLYDCLRDNRLHSATIEALNQIVQFIQIGDYGNALQVHTQIAFGSDFSQCAGFMPGLKVLIQSASDLQVYLR
ncbi:COPII coat complex component secretory 31 isoform X2 [Musca autumnalis]|uniref:COPII coat complex component secretory 31 isoform X2 n=1 Tax=Musca autumnalis TaxID=221902 RepID=UPI003CF38703